MRELAGNAEDVEGVVDEHDAYAPMLARLAFYENWIGKSVPAFLEALAVPASPAPSFLDRPRDEKVPLLALALPGLVGLAGCGADGPEDAVITSSAGMPSGRVRPSPFGMCTRRTGCGW